ncbi:uncharacterized protein METZ01_LOCUS457147, partial [marine metagenome]
FDVGHKIGSYTKYFKEMFSIRYK